MTIERLLEPVIEGPSSAEYNAWLKTRPDLLARLHGPECFTVGAGYEIWRNSWLRCRDVVTTASMRTDNTEAAADEIVWYEQRQRQRQQAQPQGGELLPACGCPFCGCRFFKSKLEFFAAPTDGSGNRWFIYRCPKCKAQIALISKTEEDAIAAWNTRAGLPRTTADDGYQWGPPLEQAERIVKTWRATDQHDKLLVHYIAQAIRDNATPRPG